MNASEFPSLFRPVVSVKGALLDLSLTVFRVVPYDLLVMPRPEDVI